MGFVGDLKFETQLDFGELKYSMDQVEHLWEALEGEAAYADKSKAIIRCRGNLSDGVSIGSRFGSIERRDGRLYYRLDKVNLDQTVATPLQILDELALVFRNDEGLCEFDRDAVYLPMAIAAAWVAHGKSYEMSYDTLQHTAVVFLLTPASDKAGLAVGRCVNIIGEARDEWEIEWRESLWNPICNGLILVGR